MFDEIDEKEPWTNDVVLTTNILVLPVSNLINLEFGLWCVLSLLHVTSECPLIRVCDYRVQLDLLACLSGPANGDEMNSPARPERFSVSASRSCSSRSNRLGLSSSMQPFLPASELVIHGPSCTVDPTHHPAYFISQCRRNMSLSKFFSWRFNAAHWHLQSHQASERHLHTSSWSQCCSINGKTKHKDSMQIKDRTRIKQALEM